MKENLTPLLIIRRELKRAEVKHPAFLEANAMSALAEEVGEVAREVNDYGDGRNNNKDYRRQVVVELAHVIVVAFRWMCALLVEDNKNWRDN